MEIVDGSTAMGGPVAEPKRLGNAATSRGWVAPAASLEG
jgi:hypothetical protein